MELRRAALAALTLIDPTAKAEATLALAAAAQQAGVDPSVELQAASALPGRPAQPRLVHPRELPRRDIGSREGRAALLHAIAHIEFNAINLALDAVWRFPQLPIDYYCDWARVAGEEAQHFNLVRTHLAALGTAYGDFDAHDGLWAMCEKTAGDPLARMALVPRTLEARGLDANPGIRRRLAAVGDTHGAEILDIILRDEIGHVAIGNRWFGWLCSQRRLDPLAAFAELARQHGAPRLARPFNLQARRAAGFSEDELAAL